MVFPKVGIRLVPVRAVKVVLKGSLHPWSPSAILKERLFLPPYKKDLGELRQQGLISRALKACGMIYQRVSNWKVTN